MPRVLIGLNITNSNIINLTSPNVSNDNLREHMDDTNDQCQMFKNKLDSPLDKFKVCSKATKEGTHELILFFAHHLFYADTSPTRGDSAAVCT